MYPPFYPLCCASFLNVTAQLITIEIHGTVDPKQPPNMATWLLGAFATPERSLEKVQDVGGWGSQHIAVEDMGSTCSLL